MDSAFSGGRVDPYLFPARGRKLAPNLDANLLPILKLLIPTFSPQGDGNNQKHEAELTLNNQWLIPTFSPQGDGNEGMYLM